MKQQLVQTVNNYLSALEAADLEKLLSLFTDDARVKSPLYGYINAKQFYSDLFVDTESSVLTVHDVFLSTSDNPKAAAHFHYQWQMKNGSVTEFECVDVFEFDGGTGKIASLSIIYDSGRTRAAFEELRSEGLQEN